MKMRTANDVMVAFFDEGDPAIPVPVWAWDSSNGRVIKFRDRRTRDQRAADLLYLLASHGIALRPRGPDWDLLTKEILKLGAGVMTEIFDLKPELLARLRAGGRPGPLCVRLSALGWSSERISAIELGDDEIVINVESDAVTIVREKDWGGMRKVHRCAQMHRDNR